MTTANRRNPEPTVLLKGRRSAARPGEGQPPPPVLRPAARRRAVVGAKRCGARWALPLSTAAVVAAVWLGGRVPLQGQFATRVQQVEVYATVTRADGMPVTDLTAADFEVLEDGVRMPVSTFVSGEFPLTVALGVDRSWSMAGQPLRLAVAASQSFLRALRPADRTMVWAIADGATVVAPFEAPRDEQIRALGALDPWSTTALRDGVAAALDRLHAEPGRQALVVFTDGDDKTSRLSSADLLDRVRRSRALVYGVVVGKEPAPILAEMAVLSGGRSWRVRDMRGLDGALATVARELSHQYLLGYAPATRPVSESPRWRAITVRVSGRAGALRVRARDGYVE